MAYIKTEWLRAVNKWRIVLTGCSLLVLAASCEKFLEVDPPKNQLSTQKVFLDSLSSTSAILGIYSKMIEGSGVAIGKIPVLSAMAADEVTTSVASDIDFNNNEIQVNNEDVATLWSNLYTYIYEANAVLEGLGVSETVKPSVKSQIMGEAYLVRAWCYFYLANLWGQAPLVVSTDYRVSDKMPRTSKDSILSQIISDLQAAKTNLPANYLSAEKTRPNKWAATALLARVYLYKKDWVNAETQAQEIIASNLYSPLPALANVFLKGSKETIWQLNAVNASFNAPEGNLFIPTNATLIPRYPITDTLFKSFEATDQRRTAWLGSNTISGVKYYYPYKYKVRVSSSATAATEYPIMFRFAEVLLIHAEASAHQGKTMQWKNDLDAVRIRAGLAGISDQLSPEQMLSAVESERQHELFAEHGHRWMDLKRTPSTKGATLSRADDLLSVLKGNVWQATDTLWPVPNGQRLANPFLSQNAGYTK